MKKIKILSLFSYYLLNTASLYGLWLSLHATNYFLVSMNWGDSDSNTLLHFCHTRCWGSYYFLLQPKFEANEEGLPKVFLYNNGGKIDTMIKRGLTYDDLPINER